MAKQKHRMRTTVLDERTLCLLVLPGKTQLVYSNVGMSWKQVVLASLWQRNAANGRKEVAVTIAVDRSPSGDPGVCAGSVRAAVGGQADGSDVVGEGDRWGELQQAYVVVLSVAVVVGVVDDLEHTSRHLVWIFELLVAASEVDCDAQRAGSRGKIHFQLKSSSISRLLFGFNLTIGRWSSCVHDKQAEVKSWRRPNSRLETVGGRQDPLVGDQGASAWVASKLVQTGLPGPGARGSVLTTHNPGVEGCDPANWS